MLSIGKLKRGGQVMGEDDRRQFQRKRKQSIVSFYVIREDGKNSPRQAEVIDGSRGGVRFKTEMSLPKNTRLYIKLDSGEWGEELTYLCKDEDMGLIEVLGSVMWCLESSTTPGEYEVGTRFINKIEQ